jgi:hypothetical protein
MCPVFKNSWLPDSQRHHCARRRYRAFDMNLTFCLPLERIHPLAGWKSWLSIFTATMTETWHSENTIKDEMVEKGRE